MDRSGLAASLGPGIQLTTHQRQWLFDTIVSISGALQDARITLDFIDPLGVSDAGGFQTIAYLAYVKPIKTPNETEHGNLALQVLATQSGGLVINSVNDLAAEMARCVSDANAFYVLTFDALPGDGPNEYHALDIKVGSPA